MRCKSNILSKIARNFNTTSIGSMHFQLKPHSLSILTLINMAIEERAESHSEGRHPAEIICQPKRTCFYPSFGSFIERLESSVDLDSTQVVDLLHERMHALQSVEELLDFRVKMRARLLESSNTPLENIYTHVYRNSVFGVYIREALLSLDEDVFELNSDGLSGESSNSFMKAMKFYINGTGGTVIRPLHDVEEYAIRQSRSITTMASLEDSMQEFVSISNYMMKCYPNSTHVAKYRADVHMRVRNYDIAKSSLNRYFDMLGMKLQRSAKLKEKWIDEKTEDKAESSLRYSWRNTLPYTSMLLAQFHFIFDEFEDALAAIDESTRAAQSVGDEQRFTESLLFLSKIVAIAPNHSSAHVLQSAIPLRRKLLSIACSNAGRIGNMKLLAACLMDSVFANLQYIQTDLILQRMKLEDEAAVSGGDSAIAGLWRDLLLASQLANESGVMSLLLNGILSRSALWNVFGIRSLTYCYSRALCNTRFLSRVPVEHICQACSYRILKLAANGDIESAVDSSLESLRKFECGTVPRELLLGVCEMLLRTLKESGDMKAALNLTNLMVSLTNTRPDSPEHLNSLSEKELVDLELRTRDYGNTAGFDPLLGLISHCGEKRLYYQMVPMILSYARLVLETTETTTGDVKNSEDVQYPHSFSFLAHILNAVVISHLICCHSFYSESCSLLARALLVVGKVERSIQVCEEGLRNVNHARISVKGELLLTLAAAELEAYDLLDHSIVRIVSASSSIKDAKSIFRRIGSAISLFKVTKLEIRIQNRLNRHVKSVKENSRFYGKFYSDAISSIAGENMNSKVIELERLRRFVDRDESLFSMELRSKITALLHYLVENVK